MEYDNISSTKQNNKTKLQYMKRDT